MGHEKNASLAIGPNPATTAATYEHKDNSDNKAEQLNKTQERKQQTDILFN